MPTKPFRRGDAGQDVGGENRERDFLKFVVAGERLGPARRFDRARPEELDGAAARLSATERMRFLRPQKSARVLR